MKTPTAFRYTCDQCQEDCSACFVEVKPYGVVTTFMGAFFGGDPAKHYCSKVCLRAALAEESA